MKNEKLPQQLADTWVKIFTGGALQHLKQGVYCMVYRLFLSEMTLASGNVRPLFVFSGHISLLSRNGLKPKVLANFMCDGCFHSLWVIFG